MTRHWIEAVLGATRNGAIVRAVVVRCDGSCPREVGAAMLIGANWTDGTVGGGALEYDVIVAGRHMLSSTRGAWQREVRTYHLGPDLNQCCGGAAMVLLEKYGARERRLLEQVAGQVVANGIARPLIPGTPVAAVIVGGMAKLATQSDGVIVFEEAMKPPTTPLVIYGAGHVARAVVRALDGLPFEVIWIDVAADRFPSEIAGGVRVVVSADPAQTLATAPRSAFHLVMTHSHELDEAIVAAILKNDAFGYLGMIGSATKAARFRQRLARAGFGHDLIGRLVSPIGLAGIEGKEPAIIAASVAADLLLRRQTAVNGN